MSEYIIMFVLVAAVLGFVSVLIATRLRASGASPARVRRVIVELWLTFLLILAAFGYVSAVLGSPGTGITDQLARFGELATGSKILVILALLVALGLFIHFVVMMQRFNTTHSPEDGGTHE